MAIPKVKRYGRGDRIHVQAQRIWLILIAHVMTSGSGPKNPYTVTYGDLALKMGYGDRRVGFTLGRQLGIIGWYCVDNGLPPLNCIVVNQDTGLPGAEVVLRPGKKLGQEQAAVMKEDWFSTRIPTTGTLRQVWESRKPGQDDGDGDED